MAGRNFTPVSFGLEKNIVQLYARVVFGSNGAPILDTANSKGICNVALNAVSFTGATTNSTTVIGTVSSFQGLFSGMTVTTSSSAALQANTVISSASSLALSFNNQSIFTAAGVPFTAVGGQYIFQFGTQAGQRLDGYFKLLDWNYVWDESTGSASGSALQSQLAPAASNGFIIGNKTQIRTIPATGTSGSTDCTLTVQFGTAAGVQFQAVQPVAGEVLRCSFTFCNSSSI